MDLLSIASKASCQSHVKELEVYCINKSCKFFHYNCDGTKDQGWGCGYRTLQSLCSYYSTHETPSLDGIQRSLVETGDKPNAFVGSKQWIGCVEASIVLNQLYHVDCKLIHVRSGADVDSHIPELCNHFQSCGSPVMIGGDADAASKTLIGIATNCGRDCSQTYLLIADPHYTGPADENVVLETEFAKWRKLDLFDASSFYNFCFPLPIAQL